MQFFDNLLDNLLYIYPFLCTNQRYFACIQAYYVLYLLFCLLRSCGWQIYLVYNRQNFQVIVKCKVNVSQSLSFDTLRCIDNQNRTLASSKRTRYLISKINMSRGINQIKIIILPFIVVFNFYGSKFYGYSPLPFNIHTIQKLLLLVAFAHGFGYVHNTVRKSTFTMVNMCDNTKISDMFLPY